MTEYDPADDSRKSYDVAVEAKRQRGDTHWPEQISAATLEKSEMNHDILENSREAFERAVIERMKESGFLEIEIRVEALARCGDGYQDEVINAGWHYWKAGIAAASPTVVTIPDDATADEILKTAINHPNAVVMLKRQPTAEEAIKKIAAVADAVGFGAGEPATEIAGHLVSFLAAQPMHIDRFMREGQELMIDGTFAYDQGNLTYRAVDGTIRHPDELRAAKEKANG
ncbi:MULTISPECIES: hypothetical protein [unclassified Brucella]|uniref:hypothetical protein n=1 Tax=unclassified Brucella TaxID=2632610 RepID=UPI001FFFF9EB|nr:MULTISPECIES: hypothetical protein [unclassified Brucella]